MPYTQNVSVINMPNIPVSILIGALFHLLIVAINPKDVVRRKAWEEKLYNYRNKWSQHPVEKVKDDKVNRYDNDDIINHLTYPVNRLPPAHAKKCDARYGLL